MLDTLLLNNKESSMFNNLIINKKLLPFGNICYYCLDQKWYTVSELAWMSLHCACAHCFADSSCTGARRPLYCLTALAPGSQAGCWGGGSGSRGCSGGSSQCVSGWVNEWVSAARAVFLLREHYGGLKRLWSSVSRQQWDGPVHTVTLSRTFHSVPGGWPSRGARFTEWSTKPVGNTGSDVVVWK